MERMIVGLSGFAGVGKDEVASMLVQNQRFEKVALADPLKRIAKDVYDFSDEQLWGPSEERNKPDKRYPREHTYDADKRVCLCCGWDQYDLVRDGSSPPQCYLTPRYALQLLGTEWGRHCYPHTWTDKAVRAAKELLSSPWLMYTQKEGLVERVVQTPQGEFRRDDDPGEVRGVIPDVRFKGEVSQLKKHGIVLVRVKRVGYDKPAFDHPSETEQVDIPDSEFNYVLNNDSDLEQLRLNVAKMVMDLTRPIVSEIELGDRTPQLDQLLKDRQADVDAGKIRDYDEGQENVPPFKRRR